MATPTDDDNGDNAPVDEATLSASIDEDVRQMIQEKLASLSPEEGRKWLERMLTKLTRTEIVSIPRPDDDGERG